MVLFLLFFFFSSPPPPLYSLFPNSELLAFSSNHSSSACFLLPCLQSTHPYCWKQPLHSFKPSVHPYLLRTQGLLHTIQSAPKGPPLFSRFCVSLICALLSTPRPPPSYLWDCRCLEFGSLPLRFLPSGGDCHRSAHPQGRRPDLSLGHISTGVKGGSFGRSSASTFT